jgi:hypothetical protein
VSSATRKALWVFVGLIVMTGSIDFGKDIAFRRKHSSEIQRLIEAYESSRKDIGWSEESYEWITMGLEYADSEQIVDLKLSGASEVLRHAPRLEDGGFRSVYIFRYVLTSDEKY